MQTLQITKKEDYIIVQLNRPKVNAINPQMVQEIRETVKASEADDSIRGMIITGVPHYFSAGLDVISLYELDHEQIRKFFIAFGSMYSELAQFTKPMICAVTGHSPAGGTVIAITADYRLMAEGDKYTIGLNEMAVNVQISQKLVDAYAFWLGDQLANEYILDGKLLNSKEAKASGLVNEVCPQEELLPRAEKKMQQYLAADTDIFKNTKAKLRKKMLADMDTYADIELEQALQVWWKPEVRVRMKMLIDFLTKK